MRLLTNNPVKRIGLESYGLEVTENVPLEVKPMSLISFIWRQRKIKWVTL